MSENLPAKTSGRPWQPGQSGNPLGRPKGRKNHITELKQELEIAVRDSLKPAKIREILDKVAERALEGDMKAAKLILDKVLSNASEGDEAGESSGTFVFQVRNLTLKHDPDPFPVIDVTPQEITQCPPELSKAINPVPISLAAETSSVRPPQPPSEASPTSKARADNPTTKARRGRSARANRGRV